MLVSFRLFGFVLSPWSRMSSEMREGAAELAGLAGANSSGGRTEEPGVVPAWHDFGMSKCDAQ